MSTLVPLLLLAALPAAHPHAADNVTSLTNKDVKYTTPAEHHAVLRRGPVTAVIVDNHAIDTKLAPGHRAGYNGVASLTHKKQPQNLFVPPYAGLNYEHIHDGTLRVNQEKFEPRKAPMQLRVIDEHTVELYQPPTHVNKLESCGRYHILPDGTIEYTFECIPRADSFTGGYIGLFWASYIHQPAGTEIYFKGRKANETGQGAWIKAVTPSHGVNSTHPPVGKLPQLKHAPDFPLTLVFNRSDYVYTQPWYYGVSHGMAYVLMFRARDRIWLAQSPTGGGQTNPAWDFQWFIPNYKVGEAYGFVMRAAYLPFENREQIETATRAHRHKLNP